MYLYILLLYGINFENIDFVSVQLSLENSISFVLTNPQFTKFYCTLDLLIIDIFQDAPLAARQMAGVLLKQFVEGSWQECPHAATKETVKANVLPGLGDNISKIRYVISQDSKPVPYRLGKTT